MTPGDYGSASTDEVIRRYKETARLLGNILRPTGGPEKFRRTPEREARVEKMRALGRELVARNAAAGISAMLDDADIDVRAWAAGQFIAFDPLRASASFDGILADLSTHQVLALRKRALTRPPKRPSLREMPLDGLVERFEDAGTREYAVRFVDAEPTDMTLHNRIAGEVADICRELKRRDKLSALLPFLDSSIITVRAQAARATITIAPERASRVLEEVRASKDYYEQLPAAESLERWRGGKTIIHGVG
jgi:Domain of unknown function (DUF2019)